MIKLKVLLVGLLFVSCGAADKDLESTAVLADELKTDTIPAPLYCNEQVVVGAEQTALYLDLLKGKKVGIVGNQSSMVADVHLVDTLNNLGVEVVKVFSPEHGFRGKADAGEKVNDGVDAKTGIEIVSLYGNNKKPKVSQLKGVDVLLFDIQDVGVRFYTYISTLHYVMEVAAENNVKVIVLDRPNPNGHYVDGPVLDTKYQSFVGMHEVPVVHGMTIGEYAQMINGEKWLANGVVCDLAVIPCENWDHQSFYQLPIAPSPNLPNMTSVYLYPWLCFFEGTKVSIGRGTDYPFQVIGHPNYPDSLSSFSFTPKPNEGAKHPKLEGEVCYGVDLHDKEIKTLRSTAKLDLSFLVQFYNTLPNQSDFFLANGFFNLLAGTNQLKQQLQQGMSLQEIEKSWQADLKTFREMRRQYLLYNE